jgi:hypothetical protein
LKTKYLQTLLTPMKHIIIVLLSIVLSTTLNAQIPATINLRVGDSEAKGLFGAEVVVSHFSLSGGWRPGRIPYGQNINSWDFAFTYYQKQWFETGFYVSIGYATEGSGYTVDFYGDTYKKESSKFILVGLRINGNDINEKFNDRVLVDAGMGYKGSDHSDLFTFEVGVSYSLFKVNPKYNSIRSENSMFERIK